MSNLKPEVSVADHRAGPEAAPATLVEYGDYQCPYCGQAYPIVQKVQKELGPRLQFVFRNFPLTELHPQAEHAAETAEAAAVQGKFWEMHGMLFEHQRALDDAHLLHYAKELGLDVERARRELESGAHFDRVRSDFRSGVRSGVNGTPTFFVNGQRLDGPWDFEGLMAAISAAAAGSRTSSAASSESEADRANARGGHGG
jgi:protein-disulfide isomerase